MKRKFVTAVITATAAAIVGCSHQSSETTAKKSAEPESHVKHGTNGEVAITLDAATQKVIGLQVAALAPAQLTPEVKGFGHVLDPAPLRDLLIELGKAQLGFDNSHQELERMKVLRKDNNASERAYQAAESAYRLEQANVTAILLKIQASWCGEIGVLAGPIVVPVGATRDVDPVLLNIVEARTAFLVRIDLPAAERMKERPASARIVGLTEGASPIEARFFDFAPTIDPQTQAQGLFFLVTTNLPALTPGMAVTAFIKTDQPPESGVIVPRNAVVRFNGATWIYLQTGEETFQRVAVTLDRPLADGWFVRDGPKPESKVVTVGAQIILSTEMSAAGFSEGEHH